ncbi:UDP-2,4-diacetamido-2,4,6-trideoxy-beta-L-altropyranose hydrolase [Candidatus Bipolaricaulota bacterium]|nr:UDP-2,4-diacetamido-2,4,6-trideoxy-beta-L-altropyranose hydrolase [Candidatus Bipolaricaulota bacterium]
MNKPLIIRADANTHIGTGHLMRCLALAQAWKDSGGEVAFITACESDGLLQRLLDEGFQIVTVERSYPDPADLEATSQVLAAHPNAWVVLDGYHLDEVYQKQVKEAGHPLLVIDDMAHLEHYYADIVLNQNLHAAQLHYSCEPYTQLLLGTQYVLLRREFLEWQDWKREIPEVARKVLVTLGGGDPDNVTLKVVRALQQVNVDDLETVVVVGASNPHFRELQSAIRNPQSAIRLVQNVTNMAELMAWADVAISAGGSTCWELAFMRLPSAILVLAENQEETVRMLTERAVFLSLRDGHNTQLQDIAQALTHLLLNHEIRRKLSQKASLLLDGLGALRVIEALSGI